MGKFWNCLVEGTYGGYHYRHSSFEQAKTEAERLARLGSNRGKKVYVLEVIGYCEVPEIPVEWKIIEEEE
uniref:Uncharacterized protein n=1 Tax=viral metagenome TaxID=1070528 RepID=A0A6M3JYG5_9ZZZZ